MPENVSKPIDLVMRYQHDLSPIKCMRDFSSLVKHMDDVCLLAALTLYTEVTLDKRNHQIIETKMSWGPAGR